MVKVSGAKREICLDIRQTFKLSDLKHFCPFENYIGLRQERNHKNFRKKAFYFGVVSLAGAKKSGSLLEEANRDHHLITT